MKAFRIKFNARVFTNVILVCSAISMNACNTKKSGSAPAPAVNNTPTNKDPVAPPPTTSVNPTPPPAAPAPDYAGGEGSYICRGTTLLGQPSSHEYKVNETTLKMTVTREGFPAQNYDLVKSGSFFYTYTVKSTDTTVTDTGKLLVTKGIIGSKALVVTGVPFKEGSTTPTLVSGRVSCS